MRKNERSRRDFRERAFLPPSLSLSLSLDPNDSPVPFMLLDVGSGGGDGIETKPITSLDGRSRRRRRRLCFVIYPRGWSGERRSEIGCVNSAIGICTSRCRDRCRILWRERSGGQKLARSAGRSLAQSCRQPPPKPYTPVRRGVRTTLLPLILFKTIFHCFSRFLIDI